MPTELLETFPQTADYLYGSWLRLAEEVFIIGLASWAITVKVDFFIY